MKRVDPWDLVRDLLSRDFDPFAELTVDDRARAALKEHDAASKRRLVGWRIRCDDVRLPTVVRQTELIALPDARERVKRWPWTQRTNVRILRVYRRVKP